MTKKARRKNAGAPGDLVTPDNDPRPVRQQVDKPLPVGHLEAGKTPLGREMEQRIIARGGGANSINVAGDQVPYDDVAETVLHAKPPKTGTVGSRLARRSTAYQDGLTPGPGADTPSFTEAGTSWPHTGERLVGVRPPPRPPTEPSSPVAGPSRPPSVRSAVDVPALRAYLVRAWQPGGVFHNVTRRAVELAGQAGDTARAVRYRDEAETERVALQRAVLYYVEPPMVDLVETVRGSSPPDVHPDELPWPGDSGLVVFAKPLSGVAVDRPSDRGPATLTVEDVPPDAGAHPTQVDAVMWNRSALPPWGEGSRYGPERVRCLSLHSYRRLDLDSDLSVDDAAAFAQLAAERPEEDIEARMHGSFWVPMGHSDWPVVDRLDDVPPWCQPGAQWDSFVEDRQLVTALFTLLAEEGVASRTTAVAPRPVRRALARAGDKAPSTVTVVNLRRPRPVVHPDFVEAPPGATTRTHRWLVREHLRWQPVGHRRQERRLTVVHAHVKGPEGAPLVIKTKVNRWVR